MKTRQLVVLCCACCVWGALCRGESADEERPDPLCGAYTLYISLKALDADVKGVDEIQQHLGEATPRGYSLGELAEVAESYGMETLGVQTTLENLARRPGRFACIAHINGNHFVNIANVEEGVAKIVDPPRSYTLPVETLNARWDGTAVLISREPLMAEEDLPRALPWKWIGGVALAVLAMYSAWLLLRGRSAREAQSG